MTETDANGMCWQITTHKTGIGVECNAIQGTDQSSAGVRAFSFDMFGAKRLKLAGEATKCTEAAVKRVHEAGLLAFSEMMKNEPAAPAYVVGVGQVIFTDGYENQHKRAIYEVERPRRFKTVTLDGQFLRHDDHIRPYSEKFGIGVYYHEGDTITAEEVAELVERAREATKARDEAANTAAEQAKQERARKIEIGRAIVPAIPDGVRAVIVAEEKQDDSDPMTDYHAHSTKQTVYLAWSNHERDIFSEMRKAAGKYEPTKRHEIAPTRPEGDAGKYWSAPDEHREKYSMGSGYYLGESKYYGWNVCKRRINSESLEALQIAAAEGRFLCNEGETKDSAPNVEPVSVESGKVQVIQYGQGIAVIGDTKPLKDILRGLGGRFNFRLSCGAGWVFPMAKLDQVKAALIEAKQAAPSQDTPEHIETQDTTPIEAVERFTLSEEGETIAEGTESEMVEAVNTLYHYDQQDADEAPAQTLDECKQAIKADGLSIMPEDEDEEEAPQIQRTEYEDEPEAEPVQMCRSFESGQLSLF